MVTSNSNTNKPNNSSSGANSAGTVKSMSCSETSNASKPQQKQGPTAELAPNTSKPGVVGVKRQHPKPTHKIESADTSDKLERVQHEKRKDKHYPNLFNTEETSHSEQGIDLTAFPELNKPVKNLQTPSGRKDVICLMNTEDADIVYPYEDFVPHYKMPEMGYVWSRRFETTLGAGNFVPEWSARTTELLKYCEYFKGGCLVRLICKVPLVVSQAFWVFRTARTDVTNTFSNQIGFMWKPSVQNEVFVLMPWASVNVFNRYTDTLDLAFLRLGIQPVSRLLSEPGTASSLNISAYFAPYEIIQSVPRPVVASTGSITQQNLVLFTARNIGSTFPLTLGTITSDGNVRIVVTTFEAETGSNDSARYEVSLGGSQFYTGDLNDNVGTNEIKGNTTVFNGTAGITNLTITATGPAANDSLVTMAVTAFSLGSSISFQPLLRKGRREIFEYDYNTRSDAGKKIYGKIGDHSTVEDTHWQLVAPEIEITDANKYIPINITIPLYAAGNFAPFATREVSRHLLKSRYPGVKLVTVKTPFSNILARVTMSILSNSGETMQLPGKEWDLNGELRFEPYWDYFNPGIANPVLNITIDILNASIASVGASIITYINTSSLEYYHIRPYNNAPVMASSTFHNMIRVGRREGETFHESEEEHTPENPENLSLMTDPVPIKTDATETRIADIFQYVGTYSFNLATTKFVLFGISHSFFPQAIVNSAKKEQLWQGTPKYRLYFDTNVTQAAQIFVAHVDADFDPAAAAAEAIRMYPHTVCSIRNNIVEINIGWRQFDGSVAQAVTYNNPSDPQLGYLCIAVPTQSGTLAGLDNLVKVTLECSVSGFMYRNQTANFDNFDYPTVQPLIVPVSTLSDVDDVKKLLEEIPISIGPGGL